MDNFKDILASRELHHPSTNPATVAQLLTDKAATLAIAESITGGNLCAKFVKIPGASDFLIGGIIAYDNRVKVSECMVSPKTIQHFGSVSSQVCLEMAKGIHHKFQPTISLSTTGFAGPQREQEKVGLVYIGLITGRQEVVKPFMFSGNRVEIIEQTTLTALDLLWYHVSRLYAELVEV
ncbi:MAG: CinA family protein [Candidatus Margulisiibacteriota bacterium]